MRKDNEAAMQQLQVEADRKLLELERKHKDTLSRRLQKLEVEIDEDRMAWRRDMVDRMKRESVAAMEEMRAKLHKKHKHDISNNNRGWETKFEVSPGSVLSTMKFHIRTISCLL